MAQKCRQKSGSVSKFQLLVALVVGLTTFECMSWQFRQPRVEQMARSMTGMVLKTDNPQDQKTKTTSKGIPTVPVHISRERKEGALEFVHIPKTSGTAIEVAAARQNITWGLCHFRNLPAFLVPSYQKVDYPGCNRLAKGQRARRWPFCPGQCWHQPPAKFYQHDNNNGPNPSQQNPYSNKNLFAIVRNPYARMISEFYCPWSGYTSADEGEHNQESLNIFLQQKLLQYQKDPVDLHLLPQSHFIFGSLTKEGPIVQVVDHVLFFENLTSHVHELFQAYDLDIALEHVNAGTDKTQQNQQQRQRSRRMGVGDLSNETIELINEIHREDFETLGYQGINPHNMPQGWQESYRLESIYMT
ncbi:Sulfotransferase family [Seminavis robusta]|uniref:Sulfotransferase family n=1 Tax=Seminavis robusta TaxID=568900 RepID=A0A9N8DET6_9STRA|nr:Sulfotransferase family [Seminavis robusta]|eukprot:Sro84_g044830.1 Sulfotransferase family (358) ;mRNA; f:62011-63084